MNLSKITTNITFAVCTAVLFALFKMMFDVHLHLYIHYNISGDYVARFYNTYKLFIDMFIVLTTSILASLIMRACYVALFKNK